MVLHKEYRIHLHIRWHGDVYKRQKEGSYCLSFESHAYINLGYEDYKELGPGEIVFVTADGVKTLVEPGKKMKKMCIRDRIWRIFKRRCRRKNLHVCSGRSAGRS